MGKKSKPKRKLVATFGKKLEDELNQHVKEWVESPDSIEQMNALLDTHVHSLKKLREYSELISHQLNIPSKDDVARVANLVIQVEEKIESLEEKIDQLGGDIQTLRKTRREVGTTEEGSMIGGSRRNVFNNVNAASPMLMVNPHITDSRLFQYELESMLDEEWD